MFQSEEMIVWAVANNRGRARLIEKPLEIVRLPDSILGFIR